MVLARATDALNREQNADGHWVGELEGDTLLSSEYILLYHFLGLQHEVEELSKCLAFLRRQQNAEGGFSLYPGGPSHVSSSVKAYFALKLSGDGIDEPHMVRAREKIRRLGGLRACNTFTKISLALFGQVPWKDCPAVPPELILFPRWFPFNIYEMSSWSRTIVIPISIIWALKPVCKIPDSARVDELDVPLETAPDYRPVEVDGTSKTWQLAFSSLDKAAKLTESLAGRMKVRPLRQLAIRKALVWMKERFENSDGLGGIFPPIVNSLIAFRALGYPDDDPHIQKAWEALKGLRVTSRDDEIRLQPCHSPVWDTALAINALALTADPTVQERIERGVSWLLDREVRNHGDWSNKVRGVEPAGWYFEYQNEFYPDVDDTIMVMMALERSGIEKADPAVRRAMTWVRAMQSKDGGWAAFDRDNNRFALANVPFADHNAMLDPPTADITGRTLEMMGMFGIGKNDLAVSRAIQYLRGEQTSEGAWFGRWGVNYIYGTCHVPAGFAGSRREHESSLCPTGGGLDGVRPERGWGIRREHRLLRRSESDGPGTEHAEPDGLGDHGTRERRSLTRHFDSPRHRLPHDHAARGRHLGRGILDGDGFPEGLLPALPPLSPLLSHHGARHVAR